MSFLNNVAASKPACFTPSAGEKLSITGGSDLIPQDPSFRGKVSLSDSQLQELISIFDNSRKLLDVSKSMRDRISLLERSASQLEGIIAVAEFHDFAMDGYKNTSEIVPRIPEFKGLLSEVKQGIAEQHLFLQEGPELRQDIALRFSELLNSPSSREVFYRRIEMVWMKMRGEKLDSSFSAQQLFEKQPGHFVVNKAIEEEIIVRFISQMVQLSYSYQNGNNEALTSILEIYDHLPSNVIDEICSIGSIDKKLWEGMLKGDASNMDRVREAMVLYLEHLSSLELSSEGAVNGLFFKVIDREGKTRAHILASHPLVPSGYLGHQQNIRREFYSSSSIVVEHNDTTGLSLSEYYKKSRESTLDASCSDTYFTYEALENDKRIIGSDVEPTENMSFGESHDEIAKEPDLDLILLNPYLDGDFHEFSQQTLSYFSDAAHSKQIDQLARKNFLQASRLDRMLNNDSTEKAFVVIDGVALVDFPKASSFLSHLRERGYAIEQV